MRHIPAETRFWTHVSFGEGCWEWTAFREPKGYGKFNPTHGRAVAAHRVAYELLVGPIPEGMQLDHLCRNRACVNPAHLEPVTCRENLMRGIGVAAANAAKTHCPASHPYSGDNLYTKRDGARACRTCQTARKRARRMA